jgi:hypothetical protein
MDGYEIVRVTQLDGVEIGYAIWRVDTLKFEDTNIYEPDAKGLDERVAELNENLRLRPFWPDARDPELMALIQNPDWEPIELDPQTGEATDPKAMMNRFNKAARLIAERRLNETL